MDREQRQPMKSQADLAAFIAALYPAFLNLYITREEMDKAVDEARAELAAYLRGLPE